MSSITSTLNKEKKEWNLWGEMITFCNSPVQPSSESLKNYRKTVRGMKRRSLVQVISWRHPWLSRGEGKTPRAIKRKQGIVKGRKRLLRFENAEREKIRERDWEKEKNDRLKILKITINYSNIEIKIPFILPVRKEKKKLFTRNNLKIYTQYSTKCCSLRYVNKGEGERASGKLQKRSVKEIR